MMKFLPYCSRIPVVFEGEVTSRNSKGFLPIGAVKQGKGGETSHFLALNANISKTVGDTSIVTIND